MSIPPSMRSTCRSTRYLRTINPSHAVTDEDQASGAGEDFHAAAPGVPSGRVDDVVLQRVKSRSESWSGTE